MSFSSIEIVFKKPVSEIVSFLFVHCYNGPIADRCLFLSRLDILPLRGLWQRLFLLDYYLMLIVLTLHQVRANRNSGSGSHLNYFTTYNIYFSLKYSSSNKLLISTIFGLTPLSEISCAKSPPFKQTNPDL